MRWIQTAGMCASDFHVTLLKHVRVAQNNLAVKRFAKGLPMRQSFLLHKKAGIVFGVLKEKEVGIGGKGKAGTNS